MLRGPPESTTQTAYRSDFAGPTNMDGSIVFARWRQCAPPCNASMGPPERVHNPNGISIDSAIFALLTAECRRACPGMSFPLKIAYSHGAIWTPSNTWFLGPTRVKIPNGISIDAIVFTQLTLERPYTLQWAPQNCPFACGICTPSNTWFVGPARVLNLNSISIGSAIF